ncbi:MAG TPA: Xaa-Pro peptidase family protein [Acidimicrobiales bacterium]|nr:Xaa-Pro peptidase family protein [Acidimicrobiales bacterium]
MSDPMGLPASPGPKAKVREAAGMRSRWERTLSQMADLGVDALLLSLGADLPWLTGYTAMPLERLTMLIVPLDEPATLVVPALEAPRVVERPEFTTLAWNETDDPVAIVSKLVGTRIHLAVSDRTWARFVLGLQAAMPGASWQPASTVTAPLRAVKDADEVVALRDAARAADVVAAQLMAGEISLIGRAEAEVSSDIGDRLRAEGHQQVNFAIVASGPNAASPHHEPGARRIGAGEAVVCDFGGALDSYCSDITRTVFTGAPPAEFEELYAVLQEAQVKAVEAATAGTACEDVDGVARRAISAAGYGEYFVHRTGHGIGLEEHEDPYLVEGNGAPLVAGNAFSIEPGIYVPGRWGARIEDIVVATDEGPESLNRADHALTVVEA